jgi:beta-galactosidase/beta-glucuronidase
VSEIHAIRLHGPWKAILLRRSAEFDSASAEPAIAIGESTRQKIPSTWNDWLGDSFAGTVAYVRNFNLPTGLEPGQAVFLVVDAAQPSAQVSLNGVLVGEWQTGDPPLRVEVHERLTRRNEIRIEVSSHSDPTSSPDDAGLTGSVRLEIS